MPCAEVVNGRAKPSHDRERRVFGGDTARRGDLIIPARCLLVGGQIRGPGAVEVRNGRIAAVLDEAPGSARGTLTPGLVDIHSNGAFGVDFADADVPAYRRALAAMARRGTISIQPTSITAPIPSLLASLDRCFAARDALAAEPVARILGAHLEGPFLSSARRGAHRADWLRDPAPALLDPLLAHPALTMLTLAPERDGALDAIRRLVARGVRVSLGHTDATAELVAAAADAGATLVTHLYNAMRPFQHREPGVPGAALADPRLVCGLIGDSWHVHPLACRVALQAAPGRIALVSDSVLLAGLPPGTTLPFGGLPATLGTNGLARREDGTISGASTLLDEGVRRMIAAGLDPALVLDAATRVPALALGRADLGRLAPGALADLVLWDEAWQPHRVWVGGVEVGDG
jgi:N-acetylglucosamine-6-phosphate deacetylase